MTTQVRGTSALLLFIPRPGKEICFYGTKITWNAAKINAPSVSWNVIAVGRPASARWHLQACFFVPLAPFSAP